LDATTAERRVAVVFVDLDDFKVINDSLGHAVGDRLLVAVTQRLRESLRPEDVLARFGGDEFVICVSGITSERHAQRVADRIGASLAAPLVIDDDQRFMTCSIGIALSVPGATAPDELLRDADLAMYRAKSQGKARAELFSSGLRQDAIDRLELETGLRAALREDQLRLVYQPEVNLETGRVVAVEALLRWHHPTRGVISPATFIPLAEVSGLIVPIGAWVLREACRQAASWNTGSAELVVAVNVSPRQLADADLERHVEGALAASGLAPDRLCLEITESAVVADPVAAVAKLERLKNLGVRLALDDFGVGHSSLSQLKVLVPVDTLKIDRSFIDGLARDPEDQAIVQAVLDLAGSLGMTTVAEGVEASEQASVLRNLDCTIGQGYYFARPQDPTAITQILRAGQLGELYPA
jgi:diguanylate cyclase (GGDEF)-like protein